MRAVQLGGRTVELAGGALTPLAWHRAFGDDGLVDASVRIDRYLMADAEANDRRRESGEPTGYTEGLPAADVLRCAYAMAWTADYAAGRDTAPFERWLIDVGAVNMYDLIWEVSSELSEGLFRRKSQQ